jgi:RNA-directed DNA polymerase
VVRRPRLATQERLIAALHPGIRGWRHDGSTVWSHETFAQMDEQRRPQRRSGSRLRHPHKTRTWGDQTSWRCAEGPRRVTPQARGKRCRCHTETLMQRHGNVQGRRSPYEGDAVYWGRRRAHHPGVSRRVARLLQRPDGRCADCGDACKAGAVLEGDHLSPRTHGGRDDATTWPL